MMVRIYYCYLNPHVLSSCSYLLLYKASGYFVPLAIAGNFRPSRVSLNGSKCKVTFCSGTIISLLLFILPFLLLADYPVHTLTRLYQTSALLYLFK